MLLASVQLVFLVDYSPKWLSSTVYHDSIVAKDDIIPEIKSRVRLYEPLWGVLVSDKPFKVTHLYLFSVRTSVNVYMLVQQVSVLLFLLISTEHGVQLRLLTRWHKMKSSVNDQSYYNSSRGRRLEWTSGAIFTAIHLTRETLRPGSERWSGPGISRHDKHTVGILSHVWKCSIWLHQIFEASHELRINIFTQKENYEFYLTVRRIALRWSQKSSLISSKNRDKQIHHVLYLSNQLNYPYPYSAGFKPKSGRCLSRCGANR